VACGITHPHAATHAIIRREPAPLGAACRAHHRDRPALLPLGGGQGGALRREGAPSGVLEPEGLDDHAIYPNGISTSLPEEVQLELVRSIAGLERAVILRPGYAIEYDHVDPRSPAPDAGMPRRAGLFLAGQVNGTTGYEEAAAQGPARRGQCRDARGGRAPDATLGRTEAYLGVLVDDLTLQGVSEPYRMLTARAEHRLHLRPIMPDCACWRRARHGTVSARHGALPCGRMPPPPKRRWRERGRWVPPPRNTCGGRAGEPGRRPALPVRRDRPARHDASRGGSPVPLVVRPRAARACASGG
jgi:hypothetical protein